MLRCKYIQRLQFVSKTMNIKSMSLMSKRRMVEGDASHHICPSFTLSFLLVILFMKAWLNEASFGWSLRSPRLESQFIDETETDTLLHHCTLMLHFKEKSLFLLCSWLASSLNTDHTQCLSLITRDVKWQECFVFQNQIEQTCLIISRPRFSLKRG